ncbi:MAG: uracil permease [Veillonellaceae bacterium]|nr:uracil permease [Veillonellaceae bacterium]
MKEFVDVDERLPLSKTIPLSIQHLFAMFGATVLVPFLLGVDTATALLLNGIGTLLYLVVCKGRLPAYLGSSFAFIAPVTAVMAAPGLGYSAAQSGFIVFGFSFVVLAFVVKKIGVAWIDTLFPPAAMGAIVAIIGLELAPTAMGMAGFIGAPPAGMDAVTARLISGFTLVMTILFSLFGTGFMAIIPILLGVVSGYLLSLAFGAVDLAAVAAAPWFAVPTLYTPTWSWEAIFIILPAVFVVFAEHVGHLVVTGHVVGRDLMKDPGLSRSLLGDGLSNILSGLAGATPNTTYGENIGVMAITRVYSTRVIGGAAIIAIVCSFIGKIAAVIHGIPVPVMGGVCILLFGIIATTGLRMLIEQRVDYTRPENLILTAVTLISGLSGAVLDFGPFHLQGMALATVVAMVMAICLRLSRSLRKE